MKYANYKNVELTDGFWKAKQALNSRVTIEEVWKRFYESGRIAAFDFSWKEGMEKKPNVFWDSDVAKWIEGASYIIAKNGSKTLIARIESIIDKIEEHQFSDGYFNTYYGVCEPENRFTVRNNHELYCAGHMFEAATAYFEATGRDRFLKCMEKYADCIEKTFAEDKSAGFITPGHPEIELALIRMYNTTKKIKYLNLAEFFIENRGKHGENLTENTKPPYAQDNLPARELHEALGHAVRACYFYKAMADMAYLKKDSGLFSACKNIYEDITNKKMYITGGIGSASVGETFTLPYDLPNASAYCETCAAISMAMFCRSMAQNNNCSSYADIIEREIYNGILSGISLDGKSFFYENPLEIDLKNYIRNTSTINNLHYPNPRRQRLFECSCCPPNISRFLASIGEYIYAAEGDTVFVNQFAGSTLSLGKINVVQKTDYPKCGIVNIKAKGVKCIMVRIPSWCENYTVNCPYSVSMGYIKIEKPVSFTVDFKMEPKIIYSNPEIYSNVGKAAVSLGPIIYCSEGIDNTENLHSLYINRHGEFKVNFSEDYGLNTVIADGLRITDSQSLYSSTKPQFVKTKIKMIPYSCFANREKTNMLVWHNIC